MDKGSDSEARLSGPASLLCCFLALLPWGGGLVGLLCLSFLICKMDLVEMPTSGGFGDYRMGLMS